MEREYLQSIAETASRALERARLREAERRERARVEALSEITRLLAAALTPEAIGDVVIDRVRAAVGGADALSLGVISQDRQRLEWVTAIGSLDEIRRRFPDPSLNVPAAVTDAARTGRPVLIRTPGEYEQRYPGPQTPAIVAQASSWLAWPLRVGATTVGSIAIAWTSPQQFEPGPLAFRSSPSLTSSRKRSSAPASTPTSTRSPPSCSARSCRKWRRSSLALISVCRTGSQGPPR